MNIYEKIQKVRVELQKMNLKKTGDNRTFKYYELSDFLPQAMQLFAENKLFSSVNFGNDIAILLIINTEKPDERETWTSTIAGTSERLGAPIQQLGAMQTYLRRYLYMNALEIVESDMLDAISENKKEKTENKQSVSDAQIKRLYAISKAKGITEEQVKEVIKKSYNKDSTKDLSKIEYDEIVKRMEAKENKN